MEKIELPEQVISIDGKRCQVITVQLRHKEEYVDIEYTNFLSNYKEYVDPLQIEIDRLNKVIEAMKAKNKKPRGPYKPRRILTPIERAEVYNLILSGESNTAIAEQYGCSDSTVSKLRKTMPDEFVETFVKEI